MKTGHRGSRWLVAIIVAAACARPRETARPAGSSGSALDPQPPAPSPSPESIDLGPPPSSEPIGSDHPISIPTSEAVSLDGNWLVICQSRADTDGKPGIRTWSGGMHDGVYGDRLHPYLVASDGPGIPIDGALVRRDGRFWAVAVDADLIVFETADPRAPSAPGYGGPRELDPSRIRARIPRERIAAATSAGFDDDAELFAFVEKDPRSVVVVDLRDGTERRLAHGKGFPVSLFVSDRVAHVVLRRTRPQAESWQPPWLCQSGAPSCILEQTRAHPTFSRSFEISRQRLGARVDATFFSSPVRRWLEPVRPGVLYQDRQAGVLLRRRRDGAIVWETGSTQAEIVPPDAGGAVQQIVDVGGALVVCSGPDHYARPLKLFRREGPPVDLGLTCRRPEDTDILAIGHGTLAHHDPRLGYTSAVVNVTSGQVRHLDRAHRVLFEHKGKTYLSAQSTHRRPAHLAAIDWGADEYAVVSLGHDMFDLVAEDWWYVNAGHLIDLDTATVVGDVRKHIVPVAIANTGHVLMPEAAGGTRVRAGPLRWEAPFPPTIPAPPPAGRAEPSANESCGEQIRFCGREYPSDANRVECNDENLGSLEPLRCLPRLRIAVLSYWGTEPRAHTELSYGTLAGPPDVDLSPLSGLAELKWLSIRRRPVRDLSPLSHLPLENLDLADTPVESLGWIVELNRLRALDISGTQVEDISILSSVDTLERLTLGRTRVRDLDALRGLSLTMLDLEGAVAIKSIAALASHPELGFLGMRGTAVEDLSPLAGLEKLTQLDISWTAVRRIDALATVPNLEWLSASGTRVRDLRPLRGNTKLEGVHVDAVGRAPASVRRHVILP